MKRINLLLYSLLVFFTVGLQSCGSDDAEIAVSDKDKLVGYWAITHIKTIEHIDENHNTTDTDVPAHGLDSYAADVYYRYDVLIFDEDYVTVRGDMPNRPKEKDFDIDTADGQIQYLNELEKWNESIGSMTDALACPVGPYSINEKGLIIGSLNMGCVDFTSDNEFTLDYKKPLKRTGDYRRQIYTYTRIYNDSLSRCGCCRTGPADMEGAASQPRLVRKSLIIHYLTKCAGWEACASI